jgi:hypothetical protein
VYTAGKPDVVHTKAVSKAASETVLFYFEPSLISILDMVFDYGSSP